MDYYWTTDRRMAGEKVTVGMNGGAPWGFRLYGGEADPLLVAKVGVSATGVIHHLSYTLSDSRSCMVGTMTVILLPTRRGVALRKRNHVGPIKC